MCFRKDEWMGNRWPSIDVEPMDQNLFYRLLSYLTVTFQVQMPRIIDTIDGYAADFEIQRCPVSLGIDAYMFTLGCQQPDVRDTILAALSALPEDYFDDPPDGAA